jgi:hypothetical protein
MITALMCFVKKVSDYSPSTPLVDDPSNLRIKIPKCTYITCNLCKNTYIKEHDKTCPCLKSNGKD